MNNYIDQYSRYHHKPVTATNLYPSGNGYLYTAYAVKTGLPVNTDKLSQCFKATSIKLGSRYELIRNPGMTTSPFSRDEVLGAVYLGLLKPEHIKDWNFSPYPIPEFSAINLVKQLVLLYKFRDYRNYFWENNLDQIYRFAFSVPHSDRYFILKTWDKLQWYNPAHWYYSLRNKIDSVGKPKPGNGIAFLKHGGRENELAMLMEFPEDHPIRGYNGL